MDKEILLACRDACLGYEGRRPFGSIWIFRCGEETTSASWARTAPANPRCSKACWACCAPLSGRIERGGSLRSGAIGYLPQQTRAQKDFPATVTEVVRSGLFGCPGGHRLLYTGAKGPGPREHGQAGHPGAEGPVLPGALRGPAAAGAPGPGPCAQPESC